MKYDVSGNRSRRRARIQELQLKLQTDSPQEMGTMDTEGEHPHAARALKKRPSLLGWQVIASILLLLAVFTLDRVDAKWVHGWQSTVHDALTRDYDFAGTASWVERQWGQFPTLLPTIELSRTKEAIPVFSAPLTGIVVESFTPALTGIIIETGVKQDVHPIGAGWVHSVDKKDGLGTVVTVLHSGGKESSYGFLGEVFVKKNDWVYTDRILGKVKEQSLFLQIRDKKAFVDPLDVVSLD